MSDPIATAPSASALRDDLERLVIADLHGPAGGPQEELDESSVSDRYLVGILAPRQNPAGAALFDELAVAGKGTEEEGKVDRAATKSNALIPSSFGLTFAVSKTTAAIRVTARWGHHRRVDGETRTADKGNPKKVGKRKPPKGLSEVIPMRAGPVPVWIVVEDQPEVVASRVVRPNADNWIVTLFLVNQQREQDRLNDEQWLFQPELVVEAADGNAAFAKGQHFHDPRKVDPVSMAEDWLLAMLYRHQIDFAVGHHVAAHVEVDPSTPERARRLSTRLVPRYEILMQTPPSKAETPAMATVALWPGYATLANVYVWPMEAQEVDAPRQRGALHAKCAVADEMCALISSANITEYAMNLNMELSLLVRGGDMPRSLERHLRGFLVEEVLRSIGNGYVGKPTDAETKQAQNPRRVLASE